MRTCIIILLLIPYWFFAQTLSGSVVDFKTDEPLPGASIYIDGTTKGTITDNEGRFSIEVSGTSPAVIIRYIGYETITIDQPEQYRKVIIKLKEEVNTLDEVILETTLFSHEEKFYAFKKEFLGNSESGLECKILNPEAIKLFYRASEKKLIATSNQPIKILNPFLGYEIEYTIHAFEVNYRKVSLRPTDKIHVYHAGTTFFKDISNDSPKIKKRRKNTYIGSTMHWIRSIYFETLKANGFFHLQEGKTIHESKFFTLHEDADSQLKWIQFNEKKPEYTQIFISNEKNSMIKVIEPKLYISKMGNFHPTNGVLFVGYMGNQRVGDLLPLDYQP